MIDCTTCKPNTNRIYLNATLSYCPECNKTEEARIVATDNGVFMERVCVKTGVHSSKLAADYKWYVNRVMNKQVPVSSVPKPNDVKLGCPFDCGLCKWHSGGLQLPVFSITNECNLDCPKCFTYNRADLKYYKSVEETEKIIDNILNTAKVQLINLTGGEPTMHPNLDKIIDVCKNKGINRITMNTNGLLINQKPELAKMLKEKGVQVVLSMDALTSENSKLIFGVDIVSQKLKTLEILEELQIPTTLLCVAIKGINENDISQICDQYITKEFIQSITIQNITYTGKNGKEFLPDRYITIDEVENCLALSDKFDQSHFFSLASYHPLCYSVAYYIVNEGKTVSLTDLIEKETLERISYEKYFLEPNAEFYTEFSDGLNRLWAKGTEEDTIKAMKSALNKLYPKDKELSAKERNVIAEQLVKMIYIHPHMDENNFDVNRVSACGDLVPDESGQMIPACSYNLLYRQKDKRFWVEEEK